MTSLPNRKSERGATLVIFAGAVLAILATLALVIDLGFGRSTKRANQSLTDIAALSAGYYLIGNDAPQGATPIPKPDKACEEALRSIALNLPGFEPTPADFAKCSAFSTCPSADTTIFVPDDPAASPRAGITYPVSDNSLKDPRFSGTQLTSADGDEPCERMAISFFKREEGKFALGQADLEITARTVVRGSIPDPGERAVPAFLILERTGCKAIDIGTGTGSLSPPSTLQDGSNRPFGVVVEWNNDTAKPQPGFVHVDSDGSECGNATTDYSIYANPAGGKSLYVESVPGAGGKSGVAESVAPVGRAGGGGVHPTVTPDAEVISRRPVDDIYQEAIKAIHLDAIGLIGLNPTTSPLGRPPASVGTIDGDWVELGCSGTPNSDFSIPPAPAKWKAFIACDNYDVDLNLPRAEEVVFSRDVSVANGDRVFLGDATRVVIRRSLTVSGGGGPSGAGVLHLPSVKEFYVGQNVVVSSNGVLLVNAAPGGTASSPAANPAGTCAGRLGLGQQPSQWPGTARVAIFSETGATSPSFSVGTGGVAMLCQASVYLAGPRSAQYSQMSIVAPEPVCSDLSPCPMTVTNTKTSAQVSLQGTTVRWFAPNQDNLPKTSPITLKNADGTLKRGGLEDVAVWGEGSGTSTPPRDTSLIANNVALTTSGIFFLPNSRVSVASGNLDAAPTDAQFIARRFVMSAGLFTLRPTTANTVPVPFRGSLSLIR